MSTASKVCNDCWELVRGDEYFPETFNPDHCDACGQPAFVARVRREEVETIRQKLEDGPFGDPSIGGENGKPHYIGAEQQDERDLDADPNVERVRTFEREQRSFEREVRRSRDLDDGIIWDDDL